jgi:hypothetical protein
VPDVVAVVAGGGAAVLVVTLAADVFVSVEEPALADVPHALRKKTHTHSATPTANLQGTDYPNPALEHSNLASRLVKVLLRVENVAETRS